MASCLASITHPCRDAHAASLSSCLERQIIEKPEVVIDSLTLGDLIMLARTSQLCTMMWRGLSDVGFPVRCVFLMVEPVMLNLSPIILSSIVISFTLFSMHTSRTRMSKLLSAHRFVYLFHCNVTILNFSFISSVSSTLSCKLDASRIVASMLCMI